MMRTAIMPLLVISTFLSAGVTPVAAQQPSLFQELGVFAISARTNHKEFSSPRGFGASSSWEFAGRLMARVSYHRASEDSRKEGVVCDEYSSRINCRAEITDTSLTLSGLRGAVLWAIPLGDQLRLGAGGGLSFNHVTAESVGTVSGLDADMLAPNAGIIGFSTLITAALTPLSTVPVSLTGGFGVHWVNFNTCSGNQPPQYDPFCGMESFKEIELGLSYSF